MPIRLNLLAETQAQEQLRRRDPTKRAIWGGVIAVAMMLAWSSSLQLKAMLARGEVNRLQAEIQSKTNLYTSVMQKQKRLENAAERLVALERMATNRFLQATVLNQLQKLADDNIELIRFRSTQNLARREDKKTVQVVESTTLQVEAKDFSAEGTLATEFKQDLGELPFFKDSLAKNDGIRLASLGARTVGPDGRAFVAFTVECKYPEKTR